jgi:type II secretory pathway component PulJ
MIVFELIGLLVAALMFGALLALAAMWALDEWHQQEARLDVERRREAREAAEVVHLHRYREGDAA